MNPLAPPAALAEELRRLTEAELSLPARLGYLALLLGSAAMAAVTGSLWLTEPALPLRTSLAFAVLTLIGLGWSAFAAWVLHRRRVLLGRHRIVAGWMSVAFCSVFAFGALAVGLTSGQRAGYAAAALGLGMLSVAALLLGRARRSYARLAARRDLLARELAGGGR
jgi:hypothetical protein